MSKLFGRLLLAVSVLIPPFSHPFSGIAVYFRTAGCFKRFKARHDCFGVDRRGCLMLKNNQFY